MAARRGHQLIGLLQDGGAAPHLPGQLPQHQQHPNGHQVSAGAAAATGPAAGANAGNTGQQQAGSSGTGSSQQPSGSGSTGTGSSGGSAGSGSSGQGAGDRDGPGRGNQGGAHGSSNSAGGPPQEGGAEQQGEQGQQGQQTSQAQAPAGSWAAANYGYVWNMPQWVPATSMALFAPAMGYQHMQYAGQTNPASVAPEVQVLLRPFCPCFCHCCVLPAAPLPPSDG